MEEEGKLFVVVESGAEADWVRNAQAQHGQLRVYYRGTWRDGRLRLLDGEPEAYLRRMNLIPAAFVRRHSGIPGVVEISLA